MTENIKNKSIFSKVNNFNIIRLLAAFQVVVFHTIHHLDIQAEWILGLNNSFLKYFPGVPIFFFISGFLIFWSFQRNSTDINKFFKNRVLRIFPALWVCLLITIFLIFLASENFNLLITDKQFYIWLIGQLSFFQFYTPEILRFWGVGTPNGSLWTIVVELQFYLLIPVLSYFINRRKPYIFIILILSVLANIYIGSLNSEIIIRKLGAVFVFPYLYYFIFGVLTFIYWDYIVPFVQNKFLLWLLFYVLWNFYFDVFLEIETYSYWVDSPINLLSDILLLGFTFSAATSYNTLSAKLLKGVDISYGVYIYHMLIINLFITYGLVGNSYYLLIVLVLVTLISYLSWILIEKPFLNMKN